MSTHTIVNPKRQIARAKGNAGWVDYYAGYSAHFAKSLLEASGLPFGAIIADPWNGSGTTTEAASILGFQGYGFDINPVMLIVAKARMLGKPTKPSIQPLMRQMIEAAKGEWSPITDSDPLSMWFRPNGINAIRQLEAAMQKHLVDSNVYSHLCHRDLNVEISDLAAFFYNALFRSVRKSIGNFHSSNPTWIRVAKKPEEKISIGLTAISNEFRRQINGMLAALDDVSFCHLDPNYVLDVASSTQLPLSDRSVDLVLSSPPYCTRIDYAIATLPELAILGFSKEKLRALRNQMIGTSTISKAQPLPSEEWGVTCTKLLNRIKGHESKASATYYYKNHLQYFGGMFDSLGECKRVLRPDGNCVLVVQDSYYKNVHNDLPKIITEMAEAKGLSLTMRRNFEQTRTLAGVHPGTKAYRSSFGATESVLFFN